MFNLRPDERWPWIWIEPPTESVPGFNVKSPEAENPPGLHLWSPPQNDPPGFRIATDGSVPSDVRPSDLSLAFPARSVTATIPPASVTREIQAWVLSSLSTVGCFHYPPPHRRFRKCRCRRLRGTSWKAMLDSQASAPMPPRPGSALGRQTACRASASTPTVLCGMSRETHSALHLSHTVPGAAVCRPVQPLTARSDGLRAAEPIPLQTPISPHRRETACRKRLINLR
jgi:hypothetical protein